METKFYFSYLIIALTSFISWQGFKNNQIISKFLQVPYQIVHQKKYFQLISGAFIHANFTHLLFNMVTLFFFGPELENYLGIVNFTLVYFLSLIVGSVVSVALNYKNTYYSSLGASGAVSGVVICYSVLFPLQPLYIFLIPFAIPSFVYAGFFIIYSLYGINKNEQDGIGHSSHLGGAFAGLLLGIVFRVLFI